MQRDACHGIQRISRSAPAWSDGHSSPSNHVCSRPSTQREWSSGPGRPLPPHHRPYSPATLDGCHMRLLPGAEWRAASATERGTPRIGRSHIERRETLLFLLLRLSGSSSSSACCSSPPLLRLRHHNTLSPHPLPSPSPSPLPLSLLLLVCVPEPN